MYSVSFLGRTVNCGDRRRRAIRPRRLRGDECQLTPRASASFPFQDFLEVLEVLAAGFLAALGAAPRFFGEAAALAFLAGFALATFAAAGLAALVVVAVRFFGERLAAAFAVVLLVVFLAAGPLATLAVEAPFFLGERVAFLAVVVALLAAFLAMRFVVAIPIGSSTLGGFGSDDTCNNSSRRRAARRCGGR